MVLYQTEAMESDLGSDTTWPMTPPAVGDSLWQQFLLGEASIVGIQPPAMPAAELQNQFVGSNGREALLEAAKFCTKLDCACGDFATRFNPSSKVLDFGVGWGRLYRLLLNKIRPANLIGVDIDPKCISLCCEAMPYGTFVQSESLPPLNFAERTFDVVYAYSVFSHLAEHAFKAWLGEFRRLLKPGGLIAFTSLKEAHLELWRDQLHGDRPYYVSHLKRANFDYAEWRRRQAEGEFLYVPTGGGDMRHDSFYGEAIVTRQYLAAVRPELNLVVRIFDDDGDLPQSFVVLQKID